MVYIAYNHNSEVISVVSAKSIELANAFWQGKGIVVYSHQCLETDFSNLNDHPTGVFEFVKTETVTDYQLSDHCRNPKGREYVMMKKKGS
jgi:hypothetical protein